MNIEMIANSENENGNTLVNQKIIKPEDLSDSIKSIGEKYPVDEWRIKKTSEGYKIYIMVEERK